MAIIWGSTITGSSALAKAKLGIEFIYSNTTTQTTVRADVYLATMYDFYDSSNTTYGQWNSEGTGTIGSNTNIGLYPNDIPWGSGGSESSPTNYCKVGSSTKIVSRGTSASSGKFSASLSGISTGTPTVSATYSIPALPTYTVTFDANGGTRTGGGALNQTVSHGGSATLPTVSRAGYNFSGWSGSYTNVTSKRTITAMWTLATASFNLNIKLPDGSEPWEAGNAGSIEFSSDGGTSYTRVFNEPASSYTIGTVFKFKNFKPGTGLKLASVSGVTLGSDGVYTATLTSSGLVVEFQTAEREPQDVYVENGVVYARAFIVEENLTTVEIDSDGNIYAAEFNPGGENFGIGNGVLYAIDFIEGTP